MHHPLRLTSTFFAVLWFAIVYSGCEPGLGATSTPTACFSDIECETGFSCDPWKRICLRNLPPRIARL